MCLLLAASSHGAGRARRQVEARSRRPRHRQPIACRMHLTTPPRRALKPPKVPFWHDHFVCRQHHAQTAHGRISPSSSSAARSTSTRPATSPSTTSPTTRSGSNCKRFVDMAADGWWSGDLDVRRPAATSKLLMEADDLHVAEVVTWRNDKNLLRQTGPAPTRWSVSTATATTTCWRRRRDRARHAVAVQPCRPR